MLDGGAGGGRKARGRPELGVGRLCRDLASWLIKLFCCSNIQMAEEIKGRGEYMCGGVNLCSATV